MLKAPVPANGNATSLTFPGPITFEQMSTVTQAAMAKSQYPMSRAAVSSLARSTNDHPGRTLHDGAMKKHGIHRR